MAARLTPTDATYVATSPHRTNDANPRRPRCYRLARTTPSRPGVHPGHHLDQRRGL